MNGAIRFAIAATCFFVGVAQPVAGHHWDAFNDAAGGDAQGAEVKIAGSVSGVRLLNPHAELTVQAVNEDGTVEVWTIETNAWTELRRQGWTPNTVELGDQVEVVLLQADSRTTAGRLRDMLVYGAVPGQQSQLFLDYIADPVGSRGRSDAPLEILGWAPQCEGTMKYDPVRERGRRTLLCIALDDETLAAIQQEFGDRLRILR